MSSFPQPFFRWRPHPWHGLDIGPNAPDVVHAYIEITPYDNIKYEVDKKTGYLRVDRPQRTSSSPPTLYGFIPRTYCDRNVAALSPTSERGDGDPLDICVYSERRIDRAEVILNARIVGGLQMIDGGEADDKIVAILDNDLIWKGVNEITELPEHFIRRLEHYFVTYKQLPGEPSQARIETIYGREHALKVVKAAMEDYELVIGG